ncbi:hypothetical protein J6590_041314 [Homalodisca vitripennis]|nr:hypothetical protein J6590_041314 [Homalodisca vitripennis]
MDQQDSNRFNILKALIDDSDDTDEDKNYSPSECSEIAGSELIEKELGAKVEDAAPEEQIHTNTAEMPQNYLAKKCRKRLRNPDETKRAKAKRSRNRGEPSTNYK